jgi:hypothetical protein
MYLEIRYIETHSEARCFIDICMVRTTAGKADTAEAAAIGLGSDAFLPTATFG